MLAKVELINPGAAFWKGGAKLAGTNQKENATI